MPHAPRSRRPLSSQRCNDHTGTAAAKIHDERDILKIMGSPREAAAMLDTEKAAFEAMLTEYRSLRQESMESLGHRMTVMNFAFGSLTVVIAGLLTRKVSDATAGVIGVLFVPQVAKAALLIWLGEYERSRRAGRWLRDLEQKINDVTGRTSMGWETSLGDERGRSARHMAYPYIAVIALVGGAAYVAIGLGTYMLAAQVRDDAGAGWAGVTVGLILALAIVVEGAFIRFFLKRWEACRKAEPVM
jgi:hypothetical protein